MNIIKKQEQGTLTMRLEGRLDTLTAPQFEEDLRASLQGVALLTLDFSKLDYLSSAGLRVILAAQKRMNEQGKLVIEHVNDTIMEVFRVTGFTEILTIS